MVTKQFGIIVAFTLWSGMILSPAAHAESMQEAIKAMIDSNPDVRSVAHNRLARDQEVKQARSGYYPTLDVESGAGKDYVVKPIDQDLDPWSVRIGARQNIFSGFSTINEVEMQEFRVQSQAYVVQSTTENTALKAVGAYLEVLKNEAISELARENLTLHERISDQIRLRSESGVDRRADMDQIQSRLNLARSNVVVTEQNLLDAQTTYLAVIGHQPSSLHRPEIPYDLLPPSLIDAERMALANHPQLKSANADVDARKKQNDLAQSPFMPIVEFEVDQYYEEDTNYGTYHYENEREDLRLFLRLRYNLFNGWKDTARKQETVELIGESREVRNHTHRQVVESIRLSWRAYESAKKKIDYLRQRQQFAKATAEAYTKQWNIGERTLLDVLDAEAERIDATRQVTTADYEVLYSQYRILNGTGRLIPALQLRMPKEGEANEERTAASQQESEKAVRIQVQELKYN